MRFAFVSTMNGCPWGGSEELWSQAALHLLRQGHEVSASVIWWPELSPKVRALAGQGIAVEVQRPAPSGLPAKLWGKLQQCLGRPREDFTSLLEKRPDLVVISQGYNQDGLEWMRFCLEAGLPYAAIIQCNAEIWWPNDRVGAELAQVYRAAQKVFCVSKHNLKLLENQIGERLLNGSVAWNPFNVPARQAPVWPSGTGVWKLACVARLDPSAKGQDLLFQVLAEPRWRERPVELNLYGAGNCEGNLKRLAGSLDLKNVHFHGHVANITEVWEQNHLLVLPSRYEGLPLALVEAMWCARPAVVTDVGGNAELCVDGKTGFVAAAPTANLIGDALERAWNSRESWPNIGQTACARVEKLVPKDPAGDFCRQLLECVAKS